MRQGRRYGLSAEQKADIWRRWKAGESLHEIGRAFGKDHGSIQFGGKINFIVVALYLTCRLGALNTALVL